MTMTDPVADLLTRIRNASVAYHERLEVPSSTLKATIAEILVREGYLQSFTVEDTKPQKTLNIEMKYGTHRERVITGIKRVSKPGLRVYVKRDEIPRVLGGLGVALISTSNGLLTDREARTQGVGGEVLAYIW